MKAPRFRGIGRLLILLAILAGLAPAAAVAEPNTCPTTRTDAATVTIDSPASDADVSGRVEVKGRVESPTELFQVELFVGDSRRDVIYLDPPATAGDFTLTWDTAGGSSGPVTARIVACGGSPDGLSLIQGSASVPVKVQSVPAGAGNKALVVTESKGFRPASPSLVIGIVIAVPAVAGLLYAASGRRRRM